MWVPRDAAEIEEAVESGGLEETASFDAKQALPAPKRNIDLAIDVAAMSTEGGLLLFGVGEDDQGQLTLSNPIPLEGVGERIDQIVATSIAEVPEIQVRTHATEGDKSKGFVSVLIPQSPRAPHQVIVGDDRRFYGRGAKGNRRLGEAEVARLYQRRMEWEQDRDALLDVAIERSRFPAHEDLAFLYGFARPVAPSRAIWEAATSAAGGKRELQDQLRAAAAGAELRNPNSSGLAPNWRLLGADHWLFSTRPDADPLTEPDLVDSAVDMTVGFEGDGHLFVGRVGARANSGAMMLIESAPPSALASFLSVIGTLFDLAAYRGHVDLGLAITNILGAVSASGSEWLHQFTAEPFRANSYRRTQHVPTERLLEPRKVAGELLCDLFVALGRRDDFDPFAD